MICLFLPLSPRTSSRSTYKKSQAAFRPRAPRPHSHPYRPQRPPQVRPRPATVPPRVVPTRPDLGKMSESLEISKDAPDAGSKWPAEEAAPEVIPAVEEATPMEERQWFYKDASGMVQGPFSSSVMSSWSRSGFFPADTLVRSEEDEEFSELGNGMCLIMSP